MVRSCGVTCRAADLSKLLWNQARKNRKTQLFFQSLQKTKHDFGCLLSTTNRDSKIKGSACRDLDYDSPSLVVLDPSLVDSAAELSRVRGRSLQVLAAGHLSCGVLVVPLVFDNPLSEFFEQ